MADTKLNQGEIKNAEKLLADYSTQLTQHQINLYTSEGEHEQKLFTDVLIHNSRPQDKDFLNFMHDHIWAIHETLRFGLLQDIQDANTTEQIRDAFRKMLLYAPKAPSAAAALDSGRRPSMANSILSEALCKVYPDQFSIKNKRSEWALYFIMPTAGPDFIREMGYDDFIGICWQVWSLIEKEYDTRTLRYDKHRRLWYVDRFYLWVYERPETKQIMKALGYKD